MYKFSTNPFPYFIKDNAIDENLIDSMLKNWPEDNFVPEAPGKYVCNILTLQVDESLKDFWENVRDKLINKLHKEIINNFNPWLQNRYGPNFEIFADNVSLLKADEGNTEHCTHTHHYHAPHWVATVLIYLDEASNSNPGTSLLEYQSSGLDDDIGFAAKVGNWHGNNKLKEIEHAKYKRNRMLVFYDNPISYHAVKQDPKARGDRKIFRMHFKAPIQSVEKIYGVNIEKYTKLRASFDQNDISKIGFNWFKKKRSQTVYNWLKKDINQLRHISSNILKQNN